MTDTEQAAPGYGDGFTPPLSWYGLPGVSVAEGALRLRADVFPQAVGADRVRVAFWTVDDVHTVLNLQLRSPTPLPGDPVPRRVLRLAVVAAEPGVEERVVLCPVDHPDSGVASCVAPPACPGALASTRSEEVQHWMRVCAGEMEACTVNNRPVATSLVWMFDRTGAPFPTPAVDGSEGPLR